MAVVQVQVQVQVQVKVQVKVPSRSRSRGGSPKAGIDDFFRFSNGVGHNSPYTKDSLDNPGFIDDRISQRTFLEGSQALEDELFRKSLKNGGFQQI